MGFQSRQRLGFVLAVSIGSLLAGLPRADAQTVYTPYSFTTPVGLAGTAGTSDGTGSAARFHLPTGVAVGPGGILYVADSQNQTIREVAPGGVVTTLAGSAGTPGGADGTGPFATFHTPSGVAVDGNGNVYVADSANCLIRKVTPGGSVTTLAGTVNVQGSKDGTGLAATFDAPSGVALDASGNLYVADTGNDTIRKVTPQAVVTTFAGLAGTPGNVNGPGTAARFYQPYGVTVDAGGNVYVADTGNSEVRMITPAGVVTTVAGNGVSGYTDGTGTGAQFRAPRGVAVDSAGNLFVADTANCEIRKITPSGVVTTLAGFDSGSADGAGIGASFLNPFGIAVDGNGTVYVADTTNDTIRSGVVVVPPTFTQAASPSSVAVAPGRTVVFNAAATGVPAPTYQWTFKGSPTIPGAATTTDAVLMVTGTTPASAGTYTCTATNAGGSLSSSTTLTVLSTSTPGYLTNLSARANVGTGANILIGGFAVVGNGEKTVLIRGDGPSLALPPFNVTGTLPNPQLQLYSSTASLLYQNDNWGTPAYSGAATAAALSSAFSTLGAFSLTSGSLDSALLVTLPVSGSAQFTAWVSDVGGNSGVGLVELYDADSNAPGVRLVNVSARNQVGMGANILIGGFVIGGNTAETVLIRADGPALALAPFNLSGTLAQPVLQVFNSSGILIYSNTGWGGDPVLAAAMGTVGAFALSPTSQDSAMLVTLPQGAYTTQVSGVNSSVGIALVEIYEVY
jgi:sugar lactone lactonase YvrE